MTVIEAARYIGCSERHVRTLISLGKLRARRAIVKGTCRARWEVDATSASAVKRLVPKQGWERGKPRSHQ